MFDTQTRPDYSARFAIFADASTIASPSKYIITDTDADI